MENIQKALQVLRLPDSAAIFNGLITDKTSRIIVQKRTHDFTKLVKGKPTITDVYEIVESTVPFTVYSFNFLNFYLHGFNHDLINEDPANYVFEKPMTIGTPTLGAFAGYTYWYPGSFCKITPSSTGFNFDVKATLGMNTTTTGLPESTGGTNPKITITRLEYVKTKTRTTGPSKSYPAYSRSDLLSAMNTTEDQLMESLRTTYKISPVDSNTRITSTGTDVEYTIAENGSITAKGIVYFNGIPSKDIEEGKLAARQVGLAILATLKAQLGSLNRIKRVIKVLGMVNATDDFLRHPYVINGCSELFAQVWGEENGIGVRSAVGMGSLPDNIPVEIEALFELND